MTETTRSPWHIDTDSVRWKIVFVGLLSLGLLIPLEWIRGLVLERQMRSFQVKKELEATWGSSQILRGPILAIPFDEHHRYKENGVAKVKTVLRRAAFLPETLTVVGEILPEIRSRGIYEVVLYRFVGTVEGKFARPDFSRFDVADTDVHWDRADISFDIPDVRGFDRVPTLTWGTAEVPFEPGAGAGSFQGKGIHANIPTWATSERNVSFTVALSLTGSESFLVSPLGKNTRLQLRSAWPHPSFAGAFLPNRRQIESDGFEATWEISHFARSFPQQWLDPAGARSALEPQTREASFGVRLVQAVDYYLQSERAAKYGVLFVSLTALAFFLFEVLGGLRLHPVQYLLVGLALCLFYVILLAVSEHSGFGVAYLTGTTATLALIVGYSSKVLAGVRRAVLLGGGLVGLYGYLYVLLQLEDYALLLGAAGLFLILGGVMYLTRNIDWYAADLQGKTA